MTTTAPKKLHPASRDAFVVERTDDGAVVVMTTKPYETARADGFVRTASVTQWRRGPMHPDDASVLIRIATAHGTDPSKWTPVLPASETTRDEGRTQPPRTAMKAGDDRQGDFGDLL